jgi:hypothetical protein
VTRRHQRQREGHHAQCRDDKPRPLARRAGREPAPCPNGELAPCPNGEPAPCPNGKPTRERRGADATGGVYNINADLVGNQLAAALHAERLFLVTSTPGVLRDINDPTSRLARLTCAEARQAIADGVVTGGMIPKLEEAIAVIDQGVGAIHILGKLAAGDLVRAVREPGSVGTTLI